MLQNVRLPDGSLKVVVEGGYRAEAVRFATNESFMLASVIPLETEKREPSLEIRARMRSVLREFEQNVRLDPKLPEEIARSVQDIDSPDVLCDVVASHSRLDITEKQKILETSDAEDRLSLLLKMLITENELLGLERDLEDRVRSEATAERRHPYPRCRNGRADRMGIDTDRATRPAH